MNRYPLIVLFLFLGWGVQAEASGGGGQALNDLCQWVFLKLGFSPAMAENLSGLSAAVFLIAVIFVIFRQNRS